MIFHPDHDLPIMIIVHGISSQERLAQVGATFELGSFTTWTETKTKIQIDRESTFTIT